MPTCPIVPSTPPADFARRGEAVARVPAAAALGVQFHPQSLLTDHGHARLRNCLALGSP